MLPGLGAKKPKKKLLGGKEGSSSKKDRFAAAEAAAIAASMAAATVVRIKALDGLGCSTVCQQVCTVCVEKGLGRVAVRFACHSMPWCLSAALGHVLSCITHEHATHTSVRVCMNVWLSAAVRALRLRCMVMCRVGCMAGRCWVWRSSA